MGADANALEPLVFTSVTTTIFLTLLASVAGMILVCATEMGMARVAALADAVRERPGIPVGGAGPLAGCRTARLPRRQSAGPARWRYADPTCTRI
ncbi:hypothetical protein [Streptomyces sp. H27-C3]|uniref:hypothetical protein n=1 Tax=Streptomyces sp. H27-C3 TaxID=3046305 RepID=UPI0024BA60A7|nr:hypothetical protein [Streptomyces sp. H27-C3]MDJ0460466.1 hypothetical protein [Streptomyces sp. H27-C3]